MRSRRPADRFRQSWPSRQTCPVCGTSTPAASDSSVLLPQPHDSVDADGNGVSEYSGYDRKLGGIGFFIDDAGGFKVNGRLDLVDEKRGGGALGSDYAAIKTTLLNRILRTCAPFTPSGAAWKPRPRVRRGTR